MNYEACLRNRQYLPDVGYDKVVTLPDYPRKRVPLNDDEIVVNKTFHPRKLWVFDTVEHKRSRDGWFWLIAVTVTAGIILVGFIIGYLNPGPVTGLVLPTGLAMWWLLYKLADRYDQPD
jgi:hypothetical protein